MAGLVPRCRTGHKSRMAVTGDHDSAAPPSMARTVMSVVQRSANALVDLVLPHRCILCGIIVQDAGGFCPECWQELDFLGAPACHCCHLPFETPQGEGALCAGCIAEPPPYAMARAPLAYGHGSRELIIRLKYGRRIGNAKIMARMMQMALREILAADEAEGNAALLVPVPLHRWRLWWRGFNQAALIAQHLSKMTTTPMAVDALLRRKPTQSMRGLGRKARLRAVSGAFRMNPSAPALAGRHVVLVDDVLTTGATAAACARVLRRAGAARVSLISFARVVEGRGNAPMVPDH